MKLWARLFAWLGGIVAFGYVVFTFCEVVA